MNRKMRVFEQKIRVFEEEIERRRIREDVIIEFEFVAHIQTKTIQKYTYCVVSQGVFELDFFGEF